MQKGKSKGVQFVLAYMVMFSTKNKAGCVIKAN